MPSAQKNKLLVVNVAALGWNLVSQKLPPVESTLSFHKAEGLFPSLTCPVQASFRTASTPAAHGMVANGLFFKNLRKVMFWEQSASLISGERIWKNFRSRGKKVGIMFWQQSLGEEVDLIFSPAPIHKHGGGMIQDCLCHPRDLNSFLEKKLGRAFNLMNYWGPLASRKSTQWIVDATLAVMQSPDHSPDLLLSYLPHLDYDQQRHGPGSPASNKALEEMYTFLLRLKEGADAHGYEFLIFGDYAIQSLNRGAVFPNRLLLDQGLFSHRKVKKRLYADFFSPGAFAVADHEVSHVYISNPDLIPKVKELLESLSGVESAHDAEGQKALGIRHPHAGELVLIAKEGHWFAYPWWRSRQEAPDFATHVDIHNKPGYDPCELFFGWPPLSVSQNTNRIHGSHGRTGPDRCIAWSSSLAFSKPPQSLMDLASATRDWLNQHI